MSLSNDLETKLLDHIGGNATYTPPATIYWGMSLTSMANDAAPTEPSGGSYARVSKTLADFWANAVGSAMANAQSVVFPQATAGWGDCIYLFAADASSGGNVLYWFPIVPTLPVITNDTITWAAGTIILNGD